MLQRPWKIWLLFGLCLALILPAMIWMTLKAIQLEDSRHQVMQQNEDARREAELQELVSVALWRLDWTLTPLVGQEATRSYLDYQPLVAAPTKDFDPFDTETWNANASPIVSQPSAFVKLHFQVNENDQWSSPQAPVALIADAAIANGIPSRQIDDNRRRLRTLSSSFSNRDLISLLPTDLLPTELLPNEIELLARFTPAGNPSTSETLLEEDLQQQVATIVKLENNYFVPNNLQQQIDIFNNEPEQTAHSQQQLAPNQSETLQSRQQRNSAEFLQRANVGQQIAQSYSANSGKEKVRLKIHQQSTHIVREGVSRPVWINNKLLLARRIIRDDQTWLQGCWFDWERIRTALSKQIQDLLPGAELVPYNSKSGDQADTSGRVLATLPIKLDVSHVHLPGNPIEGSDVNQTGWFSPIRNSLIVAWSCLLLGSVAVAMLLQGVVTLSERRANFVSAVTHELRTPLTTFRMYAEMLAKGMVKSPEQQQQYCETLQIEADRLSHLVENVLQFARLEHGKQRPANETIVPAELLDRLSLRFEQRVTQADMLLEVFCEAPSRETSFQSDPAAIEHVLFNLVDNACKYASNSADNTIELRLSTTDSQVQFRVKDHGPGIERDQASQIFKPFSKSAEAAAHSAPGVGLGLALCQRLARQLGGSLVVEQSTPHSGTTFLFSLPFTIDQ